MARDANYLALTPILWIRSEPSGLCMNLEFGHPNLCRGDSVLARTKHLLLSRPYRKNLSLFYHWYSLKDVTGALFSMCPSASQLRIYGKVNNADTGSKAWLTFLTLCCNPGPFQCTCIRFCRNRRETCRSLGCLWSYAKSRPPSGTSGPLASPRVWNFIFELCSTYTLVSE